MKIYTRGGDKGKTGLIGGRRVDKDIARLRAYGTVDELNAQIGLARALAESGELDGALLRIQENLFVLGSLLAAIDPGKFSLPALPADAVQELEQWIDRMEEELVPLANFILPGGSPAAASLHVARTVCRRAEREAVALDRDEKLPPEIIVYLNRLSDFLFVAARLANRRSGGQETIWSNRGKDPA